MNRVSEILQTVNHLNAAEQREVLARLWAEEASRAVGKVWQSVKFGENLRVAAYAAEQEPHLESLRSVLQTGSLARLENKADGTFEIYGKDRTFYVTMTVEREFVGLLDSWLPENSPVEINLDLEN